MLTPPPTRTLRVRTGVVLVLLVGNGVLDLALMIVYIALYRLVARADAGGYVSILEADRWVGREEALGVASFVLQVATVVAWLVWEHRAQSNLRSLGAHPEFTPAWAVGWWFVPFANLVQPFRVMRELWRDSATGLEGPRGAALVGWWWAVWLAGGVLGSIVSVMAETTENADEAKRLFLAAIVTAWGGVVAAALAVLLVRGIAARQGAPRGMPLVPARPDA